MKRSGVRPFVCPSVCLSYDSPVHAVAAGLLLRALWAGDIDAQRQMRAVSRCQLT